MRTFPAVLPALLLLAGCDDTATAPSVAMGSEFQLRPADSVSVEGTGLSVRFEVVSADSRCPADAICVTQGDAEAVFSITDAVGAATSVTLHTTAEGRRATASSLTLTLARLDPYPYSSRTIAASDYRAMLRIDPALSR